MTISDFSNMPPFDTISEAEAKEWILKYIKYLHEKHSSYIRLYVEIEQLMEESLDDDILNDSNELITELKKTISEIDALLFDIIKHITDIKMVYNVIYKSFLQH